MTLLTQQIHDAEQARRRNKAQNRAIIDVIEGTVAGDPTQSEGVWAYTDVPPEGGDVVLSAPSGQQWRISTAGIAEDLTGQGL